MSRYRIVFVLPSRGGGGGPNSIVQETLGLSRLGVESVIAVNQDNFLRFRHAYPELSLSSVAISSFSGATELSQIIAEADVVCATTALSVAVVSQALEGTPVRAKKPRPAYYIQDYEPLFYDLSSADWTRAYNSYTVLPGAALFAKTQWLCAMVQKNHSVFVNKVHPSLDHDIYYPDLKRTANGTVRISTMLRPRTKRRAPVRTLRILNWIAATYGDLVTIEVFGASSEELAALGLELPALVINHGHLKRTEVPAILRRADLFLDLSDYQAFGRTALEAMASGCVPVLPVFGGTGEFARHGWNGFLVDTRSDAAIQEAIAIFMQSSPADREMLRMNGLETAADYSVHKAALSELAIFQKLMRN